jgi:FixJ family two-component response regulator
MPDSDSSLERLQESGAPSLPLRVNGRNSIWLLDDDASMLKALGRLLMSAGFSVEKFNHPAAFLSKLKQAGCSVAVLDVWMPDMSGLDLLVLMRSRGHRAPFIFITAFPEESVRAR